MGRARPPLPALVLLLAACSEAPAPAPIPPPAPAPSAAPAPAPTPAPTPAAAATARAEAAAKALGGALMKELAAALKAGGPENAVRVCGDVAVRVAAEVSTAEGIRVARTALRVRNPGNAPDAWERKVLLQWEASGVALPFGEEVEGSFRWMKPITLGSLCLPCHGGERDIAAPVAALLRERYPADAATGFREGDLRGAFTVTVPLRR